MDSLSYNSVLAALNITASDKILLVKENKLADSNFVLTHLMKQILANPTNKLCLVTVHNSLKHYITIGKRLGYDLQKKIDDNLVTLVEPLKYIADDLGSDDNHHMRYIKNDTENLAKYFYKNIENEIRCLQETDTDEVYLIIDDLSYLLDMHVGINNILPIIGTWINLGNVISIFNCYITSKSEEILANSIEYVADVVVEVSQLKTGRSNDVTGVLSVTRPNNQDSNLRKQNLYHYKIYDRGVKTFKPGESLKFL